MIDAHLHLFERGFDGDTEPGADLERYQQFRSRYGISRGVVVGYEGLPQFAGNNDYVLGLAAQHDWIVPLCYLDQAAVAADAALAPRWLAAGAAGWSAYLFGAEEARQWAELPDRVWDGLDAAALLSLNIDPAALAVLTPRLSTLRRTTVLLSHVGLPGRTEGTPEQRLQPVLAAARTIPQCRIKLSGLYALAGAGEQAPFPGAKPYLRVLRDELGVESLVWGSDFSPVLRRQTFASQADLSGYGVFSEAELSVLADDERDGLPFRRS